MLYPTVIPFFVGDSKIRDICMFMCRLRKLTCVWIKAYSHGEMIICWSLIFSFILKHCNIDFLSGRSSLHVVVFWFLAFWQTIKPLELVRERFSVLCKPSVLWLIFITCKHYNTKPETGRDPGKKNQLFRISYMSRLALGKQFTYRCLRWSQHWAERRWVSTVTLKSSTQMTNQDLDSVTVESHLNELD